MCTYEASGLPKGVQKQSGILNECIWSETRRGSEGRSNIPTDVSLKISTYDITWDMQIDVHGVGFTVVDCESINT